MAKKQWTDEEKKEFGKKMKAARAAKSEDKVVVEPIPSSKAEEQAALSQHDEDDVAVLRKQVEELKAMFQNQPQQITDRGIIGVREKFIVDPKHYPDPRERLAAEERLADFAFDRNYELRWAVETVPYETRDGVNTKEPRFKLDLIGIIKNEQGKDEGKRYVIRKFIFHEDPQAAIIIARENGMDVDETSRDFLDEMRYLRARDWLFERFYPATATPQTGVSEEVIGNVLVEVFSVNSEQTSKIPFDQLTRKL